MEEEEIRKKEEGRKKSLNLFLIYSRKDYQLCYGPENTCGYCYSICRNKIELKAHLKKIHGKRDNRDGISERNPKCCVDTPGTSSEYSEYSKNGEGIQKEGIEKLDIHRQKK